MVTAFSPWGVGSSAVEFEAGSDLKAIAGMIVEEGGGDEAFLREGVIANVCGRLYIVFDVAKAVADVLLVVVAETELEVHCIAEVGGVFR